MGRGGRREQHRGFTAYGSTDCGSTYCAPCVVSRLRSLSASMKPLLSGSSVCNRRWRRLQP